MKPIRPVLDEILETLPEGGQWCTPEKATTLASMVFALRPKTTVEIGVWMGGSLIPLALAVKALEDPGSIVWAIDAWSRAASVVGQENPADAKWWGEVDHEYAYERFLQRIAKHDLDGHVMVIRAASSTVNPPSSIDLLHIDANHGEQVMADAMRFAPKVRPGGLCVMDDIGWAGGHVAKAVDYVRSIGFTVLYELAPGVALQRVSGHP